MNNFCEECGAGLSRDDHFCQQCGTPVTNENIEQNINEQSANFAFHFFQNSRAYLLEENTECYYGILLTNFKNLKLQLGAEGLERLKKNLSLYLEEIKNSFGFYYLVLDASDNYLKTPGVKNWKQHISLLRKAIKRVKCKLNKNVTFILLFGGNDIIPMPVFRSPNDGSDKDVDSDLPYSTLSIADPLKDKEAREPVIATGRIPTGTDTSVNDLLQLLGNTLESMKDFSTENTFGLSTYCWKEVSGHINKLVCKNDLFISPELTIDNINSHYGDDNNINYFNLHGSDKAPFWYGQKDNYFPIAFSPKTIARNKKHNIVGVEACYGARFIDLKNEESILLSALANKTVSFVGSSRIAYGPVKPPMGLADIVIHDYLSLMQNGVHAGEAFRRARIHSFENSKDCDPSTSLLSLMEFNLFGDPVFFIQNKETKNFKEKDVAEKLKGIDGDTIDDLSDEDVELSGTGNTSDDSVYSIVSQAVDISQQKITGLINRQIWDKYPEYKDIKPVSAKYSFDGKIYHRLVYSKKFEFFGSHLLVSANDTGEILSELSSK